MEMYFTPWDQLHWEGPEQSQRTELEAGKIIGFQLLVEDYDEYDSMVGAGLYMIGMYFSNSMYAQYHADLFADAELIPCHRGDCSGAATGVSQDSWGRIKASYR